MLNSELMTIEEATAALTSEGQMFETERTIVAGIEMTVWKNAPANLRHVLDLSLNHADQDFLVYEDRRFTFEQHYRVAATISWRLVARGLVKGERVAIAARNSPEWVMAFWGSLTSGAVVVPLNAWWTTDELIYGLVDSQTSILFVDEERFDRVRPRLGELKNLTTVVVWKDDLTPPTPVAQKLATVDIVTFADFISDIDPNATPPTIDLQPDDDAAIFYTSGTTGYPKGAVGTHRNIVSNLMNLFFVAQLSATRFGRPHNENDTQNSYLLSIPLFHATGSLAVMVVNTAAGGKLVMTHHFDARGALELIQSERLTSIGGVPTIAMQILNHPDFHEFDTSSVNSVSYGGAPAPPELVRQIRAAFPNAQPGNGYGLTETSAAVCVNVGADYVAKPESCGPPVPVCEVAVVPEGFGGLEPTTNLPRGSDVVGELWIKGPNIVRGYWNKPDDTAKVFTKGWLHTGDLARIDSQGYVYIVDRAKDMVIRGGENIYSVIVEAALFEHPDIADCAVVGIPHATLGEEVAAVVILRPGRIVKGEELTRHVAARLAKFEVPTTIIFRSTPLPRNPQGKVLKRELRDELLPKNDEALQPQNESNGC